MTHPAVDFVLSAIKDNWSAGSFGDIPLERVDIDNSLLVDEDVRRDDPDPQRQNYVGARLVDRAPTPIGTEYDHELETVVGVRVVGLHHSESGYINPDNSLPPATAGDPVPWYDLKKEIRDAILADRTFPDTGQADIDFTDLRLANDTSASADHGDFYRQDFDVLFSGFEELP